MRQVRMRKTSASEPLLKHRKNVSRHQNRSIPLVPGSAWRKPTYWPCGVRCAGGVTLIQALVWKRENLSGDVKGKGASGDNREAESTDAPERGGLPRSSDEGPVMGLERRGRVIVVELGPTGHAGRSPLVQRKAAAFARWQEPYDARVSRTDL